MPRDELIFWLDGDPGAGDQEKDKDKDDVLVDTSELGQGDGSDTVESPVTSGADPSSWDPINIDGSQ